MKCSSCNSKFIDGVQCSACENHYDFGCAGITEQGFRKLGADRRAAWKCAACRVTSPKPTVLKQENQLEYIMSKLDEMTKKLDCLPSLISDVKTIKSDMTSIQSATEGALKKIDEFTSRIDAVELRMSAVESSVAAASDYGSQLDVIKLNDLAREQWSRLNNIEIKGIPMKKNENLFNIIDLIGNFVNYKVNKSQINFISRNPIVNTKEKSMVVSFTNRYVKEDFIASARAMKAFSTEDVGLQGISQRIYVNDHLSPEYKKLLTKTKHTAKEKGHQYVWVKYSKIHVRKNDTSPTFIITSEKDLNKLK